MRLNSAQIALVRQDVVNTLPADGTIAALVAPLGTRHSPSAVSKKKLYNLRQVRKDCASHRWKCRARAVRHPHVP